MSYQLFFFFFFFFQAEDGIRVGTVTGVQTCALPICLLGELQGLRVEFLVTPGLGLRPEAQIGRASCRGKSVDLGGRRIIKKKKKKKKNKEIKGSKKRIECNKYRS